MLDKIAQMCKAAGNIDPSLYIKYDVKRGLRDLNGHWRCMAWKLFEESARYSRRHEKT